MHEADRTLRGDSVALEIRFRRDDALYRALLERGASLALTE